MRSLVRGLAVLRAVHRLGRASLAEVHRETGLPKPTLLRLLETLEAERLVWRALGDGNWRTTVDLQPTQALSDRELRLIEVALPHLEQLREKVVWPSDLAVRDGAQMRLLETTRRASRLALQRDELGHRIDMLRSAVGRAYIAYCSEHERQEILGQLRGSGTALHADLAAETIEALVAGVRRRGYANRDPSYGGRDETIDRFDDKLAAIAVPIVVDSDEVLACINLIWLKRFDVERAIVARHLEDLVRAAGRIAAAWTA